MSKSIEIGMTTKELDEIGKTKLDFYGAKSAPQTCYNFPGTTCISINNCIAHGIPDESIIAAGDLINIDVSAELDGFFGDTGASYVMPPSSPQKKQICFATRKARDQAISSLKTGANLNIIGKNVEKIAKKHNFKIISDLMSHGIGINLHEEPSYVPSYFDKNLKYILQKGQVLTVEPFLSTKSDGSITGVDGWSLFGNKQGLTAQYEHTIIITDTKPIITTVPNPNI